MRNIYSIHPKRILSVLIVLTCLILVFDLLILLSDTQWLFETTINELKALYPKYYVPAYIFLKTIVLFQYVILGFQLYISLSFFRLSITVSSSLTILILLAIFFCAYKFWIIATFSLSIFTLITVFQKTIVSASQKLISKKDNYFILFGILIAFMIRFICIIYTDNSGNGDAGMRLFGAHQWIERILLNNDLGSVYYLMPSIDWLPLHYYLTGFVGWVTSDWTYSPRVLSAVFGSLTLIPLFKLGLFKFNKTTAYISVVILVFYGYHIFLSSLTLSEVFYIFFTLYAYYFIEKWRTEETDKMLYRVAFAIACLCLLRYEGWFFAACCIFIIPFMKMIKDWKKYFAFVFIVLVPIIFIMICETLLGEHPLRGILYSDVEVKLALTQSPLTIYDMVKEYSNSWIPLSLISTLSLGIVYFKEKDREKTILHFFYLLPLAPFIFKLLDGTLTAQARYMTLYMVPLIPFVAYLFFQIWSVFTKQQFVLLLCFYLIILNMPFFKQLGNGFPLLNYNEGFHQSAKFVQNMDECRFYLDTEEQWGEFNWFVESKLNYMNKKVISKVESDKTIYWNDSLFNHLVKTNGITHIMLFPGGDLSEKLNFSGEVENYLGVEFQRKFSKENYFIYQLKKPM